MTLVCIQTVLKLKSLEYLNEEGQVHMSFHESQAEENGNTALISQCLEKGNRFYTYHSITGRYIMGGGGEISTLSNSRDSTFKSII